MKLKIDRQDRDKYVRFIDSIEYVVLTTPVITNNKGWVNYITIFER